MYLGLGKLGLLISLIFGGGGGGVVFVVVWFEFLHLFSFDRYYV